VSSPDPTRRPGVFQGPDDPEPQPIRPYLLAQIQAAAVRRRARRRDRLARLGIALGGLLVATVLLLVLAAIQPAQRPAAPTTVPAPVSVPAPGATGYVPVPAGTP
jgi:uncharacterized SAM-binding protein YcdF (DUF218 family)